MRVGFRCRFGKKKYRLKRDRAAQLAALIGRPVGFTADQVGDSISAAEMADLLIADAVLPFDHSEKMLGIIASTLLQYFCGRDRHGEITAMCLPWETADEPARVSLPLAVSGG